MIQVTLLSFFYTYAFLFLSFFVFTVHLTFGLFSKNVENVIEFLLVEMHLIFICSFFTNFFFSIISFMPLPSSFPSILEQRINCLFTFLIVQFGTQTFYLCKRMGSAAPQQQYDVYTYKCSAVLLTEPTVQVSATPHPRTETDLLFEVTCSLAFFGIPEDRQSPKTH